MRKFSVGGYAGKLRLLQVPSTTSGKFLSADPVVTRVRRAAKGHH
jgi:hypothetical protein